LIKLRKKLVIYMELEEFAHRLAQLREQKDVSAREMSLSIGQNKNYINLIENGESLPSMQGFFYICEYLEISPSQFFDTASPCPGKANDLAKLIQSLPEEDIDLLLSLARRMRK